MQDVLETPVAATTDSTPARLHHNAWVVQDQARTNAFYEGVLGLRMVQFWIEESVFEGQPIVLSHAFYALKDGSALAFFCMATEALHEKFKSPHTEVFNHLALAVDQPTQDALVRRLEAAGHPMFVIDHGYCRSLYASDPDGLRLEFTVDSAEVETIVAVQERTAHATLARWLAGDRRSNNDWRHD